MHQTRALLIYLALTANVLLGCRAEVPCVTKGAVKTEGAVCDCPSGSHFETISGQSTSRCALDDAGASADGNQLADGGENRDAARQVDASAKNDSAADDASAGGNSECAQLACAAGSSWDQQRCECANAAVASDGGTPVGQVGPPPCVATTELCDQKDNDCNGKVDEDVCPPSSIKLALGEDFSCALLPAATVKCWGANTKGELGFTPSADPVAMATQTVQGVTQAIQIVAGTSHACARLADHTVKCWGANDASQLGIGGTAAQLGAVSVNGLSNVIDLDAYGDRTCAVRATGTVSCWGSLVRGTGNGLTDTWPTPSATIGVSNAVRVATGGRHACVLDGVGAVTCWGENDFGQLGNGTTESGPPVPGKVAGLTGVRDISAGGLHTCVVTASGAAQCWGATNAGQLGEGTSQYMDGQRASPPRTTPTAVLTLTSLLQITAGGSHTCARNTQAAVFCWGDDNYGETGVQGGDSAKPQQVPGLDPASDLQAGGAHTCVTLSSGPVSCWGRDRLGELGDSILDSITSSNNPPSTVVGLP